jgi:hypothetical protein
MLSFSISYPDLIKFPYFADLPAKEGMGVERRPKNRVTLRRTLLNPPLGSNCLNMAIPEKQIPQNLATLALFLLTKILVGMMSLT